MTPDDFYILDALRRFGADAIADLATGGLDWGFYERLLGWAL